MCVKEKHDNSKVHEKEEGERGQRKKYLKKIFTHYAIEKKQSDV